MGPDHCPVLQLNLHVLTAVVQVQKSLHISYQTLRIKAIALKRDVLASGNCVWTCKDNRCILRVFFDLKKQPVLPVLCFITDKRY